jgi:hypothetical protein
MFKRKPTLKLSDFHRVEDIRLLAEEAEEETYEVSTPSSRYLTWAFERDYGTNLLVQHS